MRFFAVIPAAGHSRRMGRPKLLMPWHGKPIMQHVLEAWQAGGIDRPVVTVRPGDHSLRSLCMAAGADVVVPEQPPAEMKISVQYALAHLRHNAGPGDDDAWLLAPADVPRLSPNVIRHLIASHRAAEPAILVPTCNERKGHPVLFPWQLAEAVDRLPANEGVNALLTRHPVRRLPVPDAAVVEDLDTPADYERLTNRQTEGRT